MLVMWCVVLNLVQNISVKTKAQLWKEKREKYPSIKAHLFGYRSRREEWGQENFSSPHSSRQLSLRLPIQVSLLAGYLVLYYEIHEQLPLLHKTVK